MKKMMLAAAIASACAANVAHAQTATPEHEFSFNAAVVSDYRYRGISQTRLQPALQGGADYTHTPTGLYAGTWLSTIKWIKDSGGGGSYEADFYAGKRGDFTADLSYDVGVLTYVYPSNRLPTNANTTEIYGQLGFGPAYVKYSHAVTNLFGVANSKNSGYLDIGADIDLKGDFTLNLHAGHQRVAGTGNSPSSYTDWKVGVTKDFGIVTGALAVIGTNANKTVYVTPGGKFTGRNALVLSISKTF